MAKQNKWGKKTLPSYFRLIISYEITIKIQT